MKNRQQYIFGVLFLMLFQVVAMAQSFVATTDATKVVENSTFALTFTLDGAKGGNFSPPNLSPFEIVGGPNKSSQMTILNGAVSQVLAYEYILLATKKGRYNIPGGSIVVNGKNLKSNPVSIEVVKGQSVNSISEDDKQTFVRLETSATDAILGQQITIEYKLYTQQDVNGYDLLNESDYDGFFSQELRNYRSAVTKEIIDGKEFYTKVIKKVALFPQRTGRFDFDAVVVNLAIPIPGAARRGGFFSSVPTKKKQVTTNTLQIIVNDPPPNAPISFSGAVGQYAMQSKINKTQISTDDAFVINMEVRGTGDGKTFSAPKQKIVADLEYYDPNVVRDEDTSRDGIVSNYKQIEYLIVPKKPGNYLIRPEFTFYDTDNNTYVTLAPQTFKVQVSQGTRTITRDDREVSIAENIRPNRVDVDYISPFFLSYVDGFWWTGMSLGLILLIGMGLRKGQLNKLDALDPIEKKRRKAMAVANKQLENAEGHLSSNDARAFYEEISSTMNLYLGNKFGLPNSDFNRDRIAERLRLNEVSAHQIEQYLEILKTCEMALFAGQPTSKMDEVLSSCKQLILSLED